MYKFSLEDLLDLIGRPNRYLPVRCRKNCDGMCSSFFLSLSISRKKEGRDDTLSQNDEKINLTELVRKRIVELHFLLSFHLVCFMKINRIDRAGFVCFKNKKIGKIDINGYILIYRFELPIRERSRRWICKNVDVLET